MLKFEPEMTLKQVADEIGCSKETVRRVEQQALAKVRLALIRKGMGPTYLDRDPETGNFLVDILDRGGYS